MAKKKITPPQQAQAFNSDRLPTPNEINETLQKISIENNNQSEQTKRTTFEKVDPKNIVKNERKKGRTAAGRARFTTMLHPGLRKQLEISAQSRHISLADVLEVALREYFDLTPEEINQLEKL